MKLYEAEQLLNEVISENDLYRNEGETGVKNLHRLCQMLGYRGDSFANGSPIERFLEDNSGAINKIHDFIVETLQREDEWRENLEAYLPEEEDELGGIPK